MVKILKNRTYKFTFINFLWLIIFSASVNAHTNNNYFADFKKVQEFINKSDFKKAILLLDEMLIKYPDNLDLLTMEARLFYWQNQYYESLDIYKKIKPEKLNNEIKDEIEKVIFAKNIKQIQEYINKSDFKMAHILTNLMLLKKAENVELILFNARLLYWQKKYSKALEYYKQIKPLDLNEEIKADIIKTELTLALEQIDKEEKENALSLKNPKEYENKLIELYLTFNDKYGSGYRLGMFYIKNKEYIKAKEIFEKLTNLYTEDLGLKELYLESLILTGKTSLAYNFLDKLSKADKKSILTRREDLFYNLPKNNITLRGEYALYNNNLKNESNFGAYLSQQVWYLTLVPGYEFISRLGLNNQQFSLDINARFDDESKRKATLSFTFSPEGTFLPKWTANLTGYQKLGMFEIFMGYTRMNYTLLSVDIYIPGLILYLPDKITLEEKLYFIPNVNTLSSLTTLNYTYNHKFNILYKFAYGTTPELISLQLGIKNLSNFSHTLTAQYKINPWLSINLEGNYSGLAKLFNRTGLSVSLGFWW